LLELTQQKYLETYMTEEEKRYIPEIVEIMKDIAFENEGELVTPSITNLYSAESLYYPQNTNFNVRFKIEKVPGDIKNLFYFTNRERNYTRNLRQEEVDEWKKMRFKKIYEADTPVRYKNIFLMYDMVIIREDGDLVSIEPNIKDFIGADTAKIFGDLYDV
jgi:hypothetical protein